MPTETQPDLNQFEFSHEFTKLLFKTLGDTRLEKYCKKYNTNPTYLLASHANGLSIETIKKFYAMFPKLKVWKLSIYKIDIYKKLRKDLNIEKKPINLLDINISNRIVARQVMVRLHTKKLVTIFKPDDLNETLDRWINCGFSYIEVNILKAMYPKLKEWQ